MQRQHVYEEQRQQQRKQTTQSLQAHEHEYQKRRTQQQPHSQHSQQQKHLEQRDRPAAPQHRQMQQQEDGHVRLERETNVLEVRRTSRQQHKQQQHNQHQHYQQRHNQQRHNQQQHNQQQHNQQQHNQQQHTQQQPRPQQKEHQALQAGSQQQHEHHHQGARQRETQHRREEAVLSLRRGSGETRGGAQSQFMAWPGGATLASAFWNAQEKVVQQFKQLQLLENPFASPSATANEPSSYPKLAPAERQTPSGGPQPLCYSNSPSPPSAQADAASAELKQTAAGAGQGEERAAGYRADDPGAAGIGAEAEAIAAAAAAAAEALGTLPFRPAAITAEAHAQHRNSATGLSPLHRGETPYKLVTFANGRPFHVHHACSPPPHGGERSSSTPGNRDREHTPHLPASCHSLFRSDSSLRVPSKQKEEEHSYARGAPAVAGGAEAPDAGTEPVVGGVLESHFPEGKHSAGGRAAAGGAKLFDTSAPGESLNARESTSDSCSHSDGHRSSHNSNNSSSHSSNNSSSHSSKNSSSHSSNSSTTAAGVHRPIVAKEAKRVAPALGDLGRVHASSSLAQAGTVSLKHPVADSIDSAAAIKTSETAALSNSSSPPHRLGPSKFPSIATAAPLYTGAGSANFHPAGTLPAAADVSLAVRGDVPPALQLAAAPVAAQTDILCPAAGTAANVSGAVFPSFLNSPGAAYTTEGLAALPDVTGRVAVLQLTAAVRQLSCISRQLLLLCALLPLACLAYFSAWPLPTAEDAAATATAGTASPQALPGSSCLQTGAAPAFLVHALLTVYLLLIGSAAWNLWRLQIPYDMSLYRPLEYLLSTAHSSEGQGMHRPRVAAAAHRIEGGTTKQLAVTVPHGEARRGDVIQAAPGRQRDCPLVAPGGGAPAPTAAERGGRDREGTTQGERVSAASLPPCIDVSARPPDSIIEGTGRPGMAGEEDRSGTKTDVLYASRKSSEDELLQPLCISPFASSVSTSTTSDIARAADRHNFFGNIPVAVIAPAPPPSEWPQWPVLLRATQEPWIVQKTEEVLQRQLTRMQRDRGTANKHESKEKRRLLPTIKYPPPPLLFMTPETVDPQRAVNPFETPFFRGRLFVCTTSPGSSTAKKEGIYGKRAMQACVQGQFLQRYRVGEVLTGQAFYRPLQSLPPQWMVSLGLKVAKQLTSLLEEDIFANMPYFLTPAACSAETLHVSHSRRCGEVERGEPLFETEGSNNKEEYICPPDVTQLLVPEETRLLGGPFAKGGISPQQRKSLLNSRDLLRDLTFDPDLVYTFNFVQNIFYPSTYEFDLGIMKLDLAPYLNQQPIELMALIDDTFVKQESSSPKAECAQQKRQRLKKPRHAPSGQNRKKAHRDTQEMKRRERVENETVEKQMGKQVHAGAGAAEERNRGASEEEENEIGNKEDNGRKRKPREERRERTLNKDLEEEEVLQGMKAEGGGEEQEEKEEEEEDEEEDEGEMEDADPSKWSPPDNERRFIWRFQMWHEKLLVEKS